MRDALSMFDRLSSFSEGKLTYASVLENLNVLDYDYFFKVTDSLLTENLTNVLSLFDQILKKGFEGDDFILGLCEHFRNLLFCKDQNTLMLMELSDNLKQKYYEQSTLASADFLVNCLNLGNQCDQQYRMSKNKRLTVELTLIKMCYVNSVLTIDAESSKKKLSESVKTEVSASKNAEKAPNTEQTTEKPVAKAEPAKPAVESKPVTRTVPPVSIGKTRKVITLDSLDDIADEPAQKLLVAGTEMEEVYEGATIKLTAESLVTLWDEYAAKLPDTKNRLLMALAKYLPGFNQDNKGLLTLKVQSDIQKNQFEEVRYGIQSFISQRTGTQIELEIIADKKTDTGAKPYTPKEKFERLLEKNPALKTMQQRFGLELDYD